MFWTNIKNETYKDLKETIGGDNPQIGSKIKLNDGTEITAVAKPQQEAEAIDGSSLLVLDDMQDVFKPPATTAPPAPRPPSASATTGPRSDFETFRTDLLMGMGSSEEDLDTAAFVELEKCKEENSRLKAELRERYEVAGKLNRRRGRYGSARNQT